MELSVTLNESPTVSARGCVVECFEGMRIRLEVQTVLHRLSLEDLDEALMAELPEPVFYANLDTAF
jgi:hypothetical protein